MFMSWWWDDKPETPVQDDVSPFVSVETTGYFSWTATVSDEVTALVQAVKS